MAVRSLACRPRRSTAASTRRRWTTCFNNPPKVANGLTAGQYVAPTFEFIFPENVKPGDALVPFDMWHLPFLRYGEGPNVGPLTPAPW